MFLEPRQESQSASGQGTGWVEVICGSMFSGKTEELLRRLNRARIAHMRVELFKPAFDNRYHETAVVSHSRQSWPGRAVSTSLEILDMVDYCEVVGIDEAQFFDENLPGVCNELANLGKRVVVAGLDMDFAGKAFGPMPQLLAIAEYATKVHAICVQCGATAAYSYRLSANQDQRLLGETDSYEARCRKCYLAGNRKR
jgi:thymidine kinase